MSRITWSLIVAGALVSALLAAFALGVFASVVEEIRAIAGWVGGGSVALGLWVAAMWSAAPNFFKQLIARVIRIAPDVPNQLKRRAIKNEIEGAINGALRQFNREGTGFVDHEVSVSWLRPGEDAREVFFRSGKAYLKLDYSKSSETNIVEAALLFCKRGLLLETRQYVPRPLMTAIDLQFVDEVLQRQRAAISRAYFVHEVMERETQGDPETLRFVEKLQMIRQHGLFTRVLLPELRDYPALALGGWTPQRHGQDVEAFLDFLETTVRSREEGTQTGLLHVGQGIRTAIVLVGIPYKLQSEGTRPYVRRTAIDEMEGAQTVYLLGYNQGVSYIEQIAKEAKALGLVVDYETELYDATVRDSLERHKLARLTMRSGEGNRFVMEHPTTEWPDIQDDIEWREILAQVSTGSVPTEYSDQPQEETRPSDES